MIDRRLGRQKIHALADVSLKRARGGGTAKNEE
jgi:hypothetical protein